MKVRIKIDCTPEEARAFLGMPDVKPLHETVLQEAKERLRQGAKSADLETLLDRWFPSGGGFEELQRAFRDGLRKAGSARKDDPEA